MSDEKELKKAWSKKKRIATEVASEIHDVVEDALWSDYGKMPELAEKLVAACKDAETFKKENGL